MTPHATGSALTRAGITFLRDEPLARHTTIGIGGAVPLFVAPRTTAELQVVLDILGSADVPWRLLGAGSNLLAADSGLDFAVIVTSGLARPIVFDGTRVVADAGYFLPRLAVEAGRRGLSGVEFGIGVPGSVGGALRMNAGAWGSDMSRVVREVTAVGMVDGKAAETLLETKFSYRQSGVGPDTVVTRVVFELELGSRSEVQARLDRFLAERKESQPTAARSAGCAFRNPEGASAGRMIDELGLKGLRRGGAEVSPKHGNFVLNRGGATADDIIGLIAEVKKRVYEATGVELREEIVVWNGSE